MRLTLTTYDRIVSLELGHRNSDNVMQQAKYLTQKAKEFAKRAGVNAKDVMYIEVTDSDWCKGVCFLWVEVPQDWAPPKGTHIIDNKLNNFHNDIACSFRDYLRANGTGQTNLKKFPPESPHQLFVK